MQMTYEFDTAGNFDLTNTQIQSAAGKLAIVNNPAQSFSQPFTSDSGFTYDNTKTEFVGGTARQKYQRPDNATFGATYTSSINGSWGNGDTTGTGNDGATVTGGKLDLTGYLNRYVDYAASGNLGSNPQKGAIKLKYTPNYNGSPDNNQCLFTLGEAEGSSESIIQVLHLSNGNLFILANDENGANQLSNTILNFPATAGDEGELEVDWDLDVGKFWIFGSGFLIAEIDISYTRGPNGFFRLGNDQGASSPPNFFLNDVEIFDIAIHTANFAGGYTVPEYIYLETSLTLPAFNYSGLGSLQAFESATADELGSPRYIVTDKYWNGSAWVSSNGSYAQSSTLSQLNANLSALALSGTSFVVKVVLPDSNQISGIDELTIDATGQRYSPTGNIIPIQPINVQSISDYTQTAVIPGSTELKIILIVDGVDKYWNGSAWVTSNGLIAQANTAAEVNTNIGDLSLGSNSTVFIKWMMATSDNTATPEISLAVITFDFGGIETVPDTVLIWGYYKNISKQPVAGATVTFTLKRTAKEYKEAASNIIEQSVSTTTDANGYFEVDLIRSSEYEGEGVYIISITKADASLETSQNSGKQPLEFSAPDADEKDITDLLEAS